MKDKIYNILIVLVVLGAIFAAFFFLAQSKKAKPQVKGNYSGGPIVLQSTVKQAPQKIRPMSVAGQFYEAEPEKLVAQLEALFASVEESEEDGEKAKPQMIMVPHAAYEYSGEVAASAYKQLEGQQYQTVYLIGNSHNAQFEGFALDDSVAWQTPFGNLPLHTQLITAIAQATPKAKINAEAFLNDHILEVQLPLLLKSIGTNFVLVPIIFGGESEEDAAELVNLLSQVVTENDLVILSSDLAHYPTTQDVKKADDKILEGILSLDTKEFWKADDEILNKGYKGLTTTACSKGAILTGMLLAKSLGLSANLISQDFSKDDPSKSVGYASIVFAKSDGEEDDKNTKPMELTKEEQLIATKLARQTLEKHFGLREEVDTDYVNKEIFNQKSGVFVTLNKNHELRGCIGLIEANKPLWQGIRDNALSAALHDSRFSPLTQEELDQIDIEVSVLSIPKKTEYEDIELGKHGVIVKSGFSQGVFLPQVATDTDWSKEEFLSHLCEDKAGLTNDCYKDPETELHSFEAFVFEEEKETTTEDMSPEPNIEQTPEPEESEQNQENNEEKNIEENMEEI